MFFEKVSPLIIIGLGLSSSCAWACSMDIGCIPNWTLEQQGYDDCHNLPMLTPGNDTRVNFTLLLADDGLGNLLEPRTEDLENGYGKVPFAIDSVAFEGLYLCGVGTHPGGGINGLSGRAAAQEILRKEGAS